MLSDYYQLLGLKATATNQEIKTAYRNLVKKYHPDKVSGDTSSEEYLKRIIEAYTVLIDREKRKNYDLKRAYTTNANQSKTYNYSNRTNADFNKYKAAGKKNQPPPQPAPKLQLWVYVVAVSILILGVVMAINYPKPDEYEIAQDKPIGDSAIMVKPETDANNAVTAENRFNNPQDSNGYYPYMKYFGRGEYDKLTKTTITITNNTTYDAILFLLDNKAPYHVIRNHFLKRGTVCYMLYIPNGVYFIRAYFGVDWNAGKHVFTGINVQGAFDKEAGYFQFNRTTDLVVANQYQHGKNNITTNYETSLQQLLDDKNNQISASHFWETLKQ